MTQLGDVDMEVADLVGLEPLRLLAVGFRQTRDSVTLQAAMQRRAREVRDDVLQRDEDVVQRQAGLNAQRDDGGLLEGREGRTPPLLRPHRLVLDRAAGPPLPQRLLVQSEASRELRARNLRSL